MSETPIELVLSIASLGITVYFWFVQSRRERPNLRIFQIAGFRAVCRRHPQRQDVKRLCVQQMDSGGVLIANNSIRQNSIVLFDCWLLLAGGQQIAGDWGSLDDDKPPWNVGPECSISMGLACFFDVPEDFEIPEEYQIGVEFVTASGKRFSHVFSREVLSAGTRPGEFSRAA